jgi:hypothetical protein
MLDNKVIAEISINGLMSGEIQETKQLLAYENNVNINDIKVSFLGGL